MPAAPSAHERPRRRGLYIAAAVLALALLGLAAAALLEAEEDGGPGTSSSAASAATTPGGTSPDGGSAADTAAIASDPTATAATTGEAAAPVDPRELTDTLFEDDLTPPSDAFTDAPGPTGCAFTSGDSGYDVAAPANTTCAARGFLVAGDLPNAALTVTAVLPAGVNIADPATRVVVECATNRNGAYRATLSPTGAVELVRHGRSDTPLATGSASGIDLTSVPARLRLACTSGGGRMRIQFSVDGRVVAAATDAQPLPAGQPTFGAARIGAGGSVAVRFTDLLVQVPA